MKRFLIIVGVLISAILLFLLTFLIILPSSLIESWLEDGLEKKTGLVFAVEGFQKSIPFGFKIERITISPINDFGDRFQDGIKNPLFTLDKVQGRFEPLSLFSGGIRVFINGSAGNGRLEGEAFFKVRSTALNIKANNISIPKLELGNERGEDYLDSIPELADSELVEGLNGIVFNGQAYTTFLEDGCPAGIIKAVGQGFSPANMQALKIKVMGFDVPFGEIKQTGMAIEMKECKLFLKGLWLEGESLSARLQGEISLASPIKNSPINMTLEIIPRQSLMENEFPLAFITGYRKSANNYSIPIKGTIGSPVMAR